MGVSPANREDVMNSRAGRVGGPGKAAGSAKPGWPGGWVGGMGAGYGGQGPCPRDATTPAGAWQRWPQEGIQRESDPSLAESSHSRFYHHGVNSLCGPPKSIAFQVQLSIHLSI